MGIFNDVKLYIEEREILRLLGYKNNKPNEEIYEAVKEEIKKCGEYIFPAVYFNKIDIKSIDNNHVILNNDIIIESDFVAKKLKGCKYIMIVIATIGDEIAKEEKEAFDEDDYLRGMIIDNIGTAALNYISKAFWNKIIADMKDTNMGITSRLSPGDNGWPVEEQIKVFKSMGESFREVKLSENFLMNPVKSTSNIYGFGENIGISKNDHLCHECNMKNCAYREEKKFEVILVSEKRKDIINVKSGENLLNVLREKDVFVSNPCSGKGVCGKCKVRLIRGASEPRENDLIHLSKEEIEAGFRLACNIEVNKNLEVITPEKSSSMEVLINGMQQQYEICPLIEKKYVRMDKPSIEDQRDDYKRLSDACSIDNLVVNLKELSKINDIIRKGEFDNTVTLYENQLLNIEIGNSTEQNYGIAVDIGTTTIAAYLVNMKDGKMVNVESRVNKQQAFGEDVITRINFTIENKDGLKILKESIIMQINDIIEELSKNSDININDIYDITIVGNTTMIHILMGLPCKNIAMAPYTPVITKAVNMRASELGLLTKGIVSIMPSISAYVGSDITAGILSCGMLNSDKYSLLLDLGTNGEMALGNKDEVITCATAAGPAFEGANIKHGIGGVKGAISKIDLSMEKIYETIYDSEPCGICGSGVLDAVAELVKYGVVDKSGRMLNIDEISEAYKNRSIVEGNMKEFILCHNTLNKRTITLTQKDVREVQLAKGAVCAGIKILLKEKNLNYEDIHRVYIGGGFGNYMNVKSSLAIGMIPKELEDKIEAVGNCAGTGAQMYLLSRKMRETTEIILSKVKYVELSGRADFQDYFIDSMMME